MLSIGNIKVLFASDFLVPLFILIVVWRRLGVRLGDLGVQAGVARLASPYRLENHGASDTLGK